MAEAVYLGVEATARDRAMEFVDDGDYEMARVYIDIADEDDQLAQEAREELDGLRAVRDAGLTVDAAAFFIEATG